MGVITEARSISSLHLKPGSKPQNTYKCRHPLTRPSPSRHIFHNYLINIFIY